MNLLLIGTFYSNIVNITTLSIKSRLHRLFHGVEIGTCFSRNLFVLRFHEVHTLTDASYAVSFKVI